MAPLSSSTSGPGDDRDALAEVDPDSFYASKRNSLGNKNKRSALSSPGGKRRKMMAKTWPTHTTSHFILDDLDPVVEKAGVVKCSDPIDLT
jgi:hypothetical protein